MLLLMTFHRPEISRVSVVPIYEQLEAAIAGQIESGVLAPGEKLPGDQDLAADLEVGYQTVRHAMMNLAERGLVERRIGKGTFVRGGTVHIQRT
jgi:DNA-binding GntR family transcriptional regulator